MLLSAGNSISCNEVAFTTSVFAHLSAEYSNESLKEIIEELNALYTPVEIDSIMTLFRGYKAIFSMNDLQKRIDEKFYDTIWNTKRDTILADLYRIGFLGNMEQDTKTFAWQHRGNQGPILSDEWLFVVHRALRNVLLISTRQDETKRRSIRAKAGDIVPATVVKIYNKLILVSFIKGDYKYTGAINNPNGYYYVMDQALNCKLIEYDVSHKKWIVEIV